MKNFSWIFALCLALQLSADQAQAGCNDWTRKEAKDENFGFLFCPDVEFDEWKNCDAARKIAEQIRDALVAKRKSYKITLGECGRTAYIGADFSFKIEMVDEGANNLNKNDCSQLRAELAKNPTFVSNVCKKDNDNTDRFMKFVSPEVLAGQDQSILAPKADETKKAN